MGERDRLESPLRDFGVWALLLTVVFVAGYLFGVLVPYYVNDLDGLSTAELTSGAHDPEGLWPNTAGPPGRVLYLVGFLTATISWVVLPVIALLSLVGIVLVRRWRGAVACYLVSLLLCVGALVFQFSELGRALLTWMLD